MREEPLRPLPRWADLCPSTFFALPTSTPTRVGSSQMRKRAGRAPHHDHTTGGCSRSAAPLAHRASTSAPRRSPLREFADSLSRRTTELQHQNGVLLPHAISLPILTALCSCFASADRIRLRPRCRIIADSTSPSLLGVVCSSDTLIDRRVCSVYFRSKRRRPSHRPCDSHSKCDECVESLY